MCDEYFSACMPVTVVTWLIERRPAQRTEHIAVVAMTLTPACAVVEQKSRKRGIAAKHGPVQCRTIDVAAAHGNWPAERHHQAHGIVETDHGCERQMTQFSGGQ
jgi:hypothetical protein